MKALNINKIQNKLRNKFLKSGVKMNGPETIFFSEDTKIGKNVTIEPYVVFGKNVKIGNSVIIKSFSHLESCKIENKVEIGPYARIRPNTVLKEGSKIGNFVEIKKSIIGKKSKVNHLSYVNCEIMSNTGNELNEDLCVEETDIMVTPSPKPKKAKQVSICVYYMFVEQYKLML